MITLVYVSKNVSGTDQLVFKMTCLGLFFGNSSITQSRWTRRDREQLNKIAPILIGLPVRRDVFDKRLEVFDRIDAQPPEKIQSTPIVLRCDTFQSFPYYDDEERRNNLVARSIKLFWKSVFTICLSQSNFQIKKRKVAMLFGWCCPILLSHLLYWMSMSRILVNPSQVRFTCGGVDEAGRVTFSLASISFAWWQTSFLFFPFFSYLFHDVNWYGTRRWLWVLDSHLFVIDDLAQSCVTIGRDANTTWRWLNVKIRFLLVTSPFTWTQLGLSHRLYIQVSFISAPFSFPSFY